MSTAQTHRIPVQDLTEKWRVATADGWKTTAAADSYRTIHFSLDAPSHRGTYLEVVGIKPYSVWCNGMLLGRYATQCLLSIDSLAGKYSSELNFSVHTTAGAAFLKTRTIALSPEQPVEEIRPRQKPHFLNFSILAVLLLGAYVISLFQSNPRLILDYFNFAKLFSIQERDENLTAGRITSSINLVMYLFICFWFAFLLIVIFHFTPQRWVMSRVFAFNTVGQGMLVWLELSLLVLLVLLAKLVLLFISTQVFKFREGYATQALNFFRLLVLVAIIFSLVTCFYFVAKVSGAGYYAALPSVLGWTLVAWIVLLFFKLLSKAPFSGFHLFFYLCASEIFPLVICFQILFF